MNIVILGGGTAGWITALFVKKIIPSAKITLIQSKEIGIIGVGEATTPNVVGLLEELSVDPLQMIKYTSGSIKNGISFENWNGDQKKYFHAFVDRNINFETLNIFSTDNEDYYLKNLIRNNLNLEDYLYCTNISYQNKIDLKNTLWSVHFDANKLADLLESKGIERGVTCLNDKVIKINQNEIGNITELITESDKSINVDFIFDCSGFSREIIGKLYAQKWKSYTKYLPAKKAIPFWLESEQIISPYTSAIAMKYGWVWKIPLQHRTGSGYVFDSDYIGVDEALKECEDYFGKKLEIRKIINIDAGRYDNFWVKNCMAVGLSSGFIEPLESTSLFLTVIQLNLFKHFLDNLLTPNEKHIKKFNKIVTDNMDEAMSFVYLHYLTKRNDSDFWKNFKYNCPLPNFLEKIFDEILNGRLSFLDINTPTGQPVFGVYSYLQVAYGLGLTSIDLNKKNLYKLNFTSDEYKRLIKDKASFSIFQRQFLNSL